MNSINNFESFDNFCFKLNEADKDKKGMIGTVINKGAGFIPRALRFAKSKSIMKSYLKGFEKKSINLIKHFEKNIKNTADTIEANYNKFKKDKLNTLKALDKADEAVQLAVAYKKTIDNLRESEIKKINSSVEKVLAAYTSAIEKRIENPGFVSNVELSEKGKGSLKAKWEELAAIKKMQVDDKLINLINDAGLSKIDDIHAELDSFIEEHKYSTGKDALDFYIASVAEIGPNQFKVEIFLRAPGHRYSLSEKGLLLGQSEGQLTDVNSAKLIKHKNLFFTSYTMTINADEDEFIRPYLKLTNAMKPQYGEIENIGEMVKHSIATGAVTPTTSTTPTFNLGEPVEKL